MQVKQLPSEKNNNQPLLGLWTTEAGDLTVEVFEVNDVLYGKLIGFSCNHKVKKPLKDHLDEKNPNPAYRARPWLNSLIVYGLKYSKKNKWEGGYIYDLNSGKTYSANVTMHGDKIDVRGFWGIELIGRSLMLKKIK